MRNPDVREPCDQKANTGHAHWLTSLRNLLFSLALPVVALQGLRLRRRAPRLAAAAGESSGRMGSGRDLRLNAIGEFLGNGGDPMP